MVNMKNCQATDWEKDKLLLSISTRILHNLKTQNCILPLEIINQLNIKDSQSHDVCNPL